MWVLPCVYSAHCAQLSLPGCCQRPHASLDPNYVIGTPVLTSKGTPPPSHEAVWAPVKMPQHVPAPMIEYITVNTIVTIIILATIKVTYI